MRIIKLHIGLINFICRDFPKQKTVKDKKEFIQIALGIYIKEMVKIFKGIPLMFDKEYQKQKKEYKNKLKIQKELDRALKLLRWFDKQMIDDGYSRQEIRQVWLDFTKYGKLREEIFNKIDKAIHNLK